MVKIDSQIEFESLIEQSTTVQYSMLFGNVNILGQCLIHKSVLGGGSIHIGRNTTINGPGTEIYSLVHPITIGSFCSIAHHTSIQEYNHNPKAITTYFIRKRIFDEGLTADVISKGPIKIGNDVWIGTHSIILTGVTIGHGAIIAANTLVLQDVPPYAIVGGSPGKIVGYRFEVTLIQKLLALEWWNWSYEKIKRNKVLFTGDLSLEKLNNILE